MREAVESDVAKQLRQLISSTSAAAVQKAVEADPNLKAKLEQWAAHAAQQQVAAMASESASPADAPRAFADVFTWVEQYLALVYWRDVEAISPEHRWCAAWSEHLEVLIRLHALWQLWEELHVQPGGLARWFREADHHMDRVLSKSGPFSRCSSTQHNEAIDRRLPTRAPALETLEDWNSATHPEMKDADQ
ncbi:DUF4913 domain-containing protein [Nocardia brasiliensis]|uniref:DUF4913 domain-containing protein n=1 Tax=Nocardia brasiliensis TaxID=37326 RepID=UPI003D8E1817